MYKEAGVGGRLRFPFTERTWSRPVQAGMWQELQNPTGLHFDYIQRNILLVISCLYW